MNSNILNNNQYQQPHYSNYCDSIQPPTYAIYQNANNNLCQMQTNYNNNNYKYAPIENQRINDYQPENIYCNSYQPLQNFYCPNYENNQVLHQNQQVCNCNQCNVQLHEQVNFGGIYNQQIPQQQVIPQAILHQQFPLQQVISQQQIVNQQIIPQQEACQKMLNQQSNYQCQKDISQQLNNQIMHQQMNVQQNQQTIPKQDNQYYFYYQNQPPNYVQYCHQQNGMEQVKNENEFQNSVEKIQMKELKIEKNTILNQENRLNLNKQNTQNKAQLQQTDVKIKENRVIASDKQNVRNENSQNLKYCKCKNSRCLKRYCDCFSRGEYCNFECKCNDCHNSNQCEIERQKVIHKKIKKTKEAFQPVVLNNIHIKGCHCKNTSCQKKYCVCLQNNVKCSQLCQCLKCQNNESLYNFDEQYNINQIMAENGKNNINNYTKIEQIQNQIYLNESQKQYEQIV